MVPARDAILHHALVPTVLGWVGIMASPSGIRRLTLPQPSLSSALDYLQPAQADEEPEAEAGALWGLGQRLQRYFLGEKTAFPDALDLQGTSFQKRVWDAVRPIPYGETRSYTWVAHQMGRPGAARAVGQAMRANPVCIIIPCHRVIGARGDLCGFGGSQGVPVKRWLLEMESGNRDRQRVQYSP